MLRSHVLPVGVLLAGAAPAWGVPWVVTSYYAQINDTIAPKEVIGGKTFSADVFTKTLPLTLTKFPQPSAITTGASTDKINDLTILSVMLPAAAGKTIDPYAPLDFKNYYVALTFTAPSRCPSPHWTHTTSAAVVVPYQVTPTPIATLKHETWQVDNSPNFLISAGDIPSSSLNLLSSEMAPIWSDSCVIPDFATATGIPTGPLSGGSGGFSDCVPFELLFGGRAIGGGYQCDDGEHWTWGTTLAGLICAWIFSFLGFFLICGLIESFVSFRSLSRGKAARRGMPICFAFMLPILSCFFLLGVNRGYMSKPLEEQQRLQRRWDELGGGSKLGQWLSWGFRWGYPPFLGPEPPRKGSSYHPSNNYYSGAPGMGGGGPQGQHGQPYGPYDQYGQPQKYASPPPEQQAYGAAPPMGEHNRPTSPYLQQFANHPYQPPTAAHGAYQQPGSPYYYDARSPGSGSPYSNNTSPQPVVAQSPYAPPPPPQPPATTMATYQPYETTKGAAVQQHTTPISNLSSPNKRSSFGTTTTAAGGATTPSALAPGQPPKAPPQNGHGGPAELQ